MLVDQRGELTFCVDVQKTGRPDAPTRPTAAPGDSPTASGDTGPLLEAVVSLRADAGDDPTEDVVWLTAMTQPFHPPTGADLVVFGTDVAMFRNGPQGPPVASGHGISQLSGMVGDDVTGVDVVLANGLRVTATVRDDLWGAWWPEDRGALAGSLLEVHTKTGSRTVDPDRAMVGHGF